MKHGASDEFYLNTLRTLIGRFDHERRERFYPFYLLFKGEQDHSRFQEALSIGKYFLDHAILHTQADEQFFKALRDILTQYQVTSQDYWAFADKTPLPMQDYLKVLYDVNPLSDIRAVNSG